MSKAFSTILIIVLVWLNLVTFAQTSKHKTLSVSQIDSLLAVSLNAKPEQMIEIGERVLSIINDQPTLRKAKAHKAIGYGYYNQNRFVSAINEIEKAAAIYSHLSDSVEVSTLYNRIGVSYSRLGQYAKAIENFRLALRIRENIGDTLLIASTLNNIAICFRSTKQEEAAFETYQRSYALFKAINNYKGQASTLNNIGRLHFDQNNLDSALIYLNNSLLIKGYASDSSSTANTYANIGRVYSSKGMFKESVENLNIAANLFEIKDDLFGKSFVYSTLAETYLKQNLPEKALPYIIKSRQITDVETTSSQALTNIKLLSEYYFATGNYKKSRELLAEYSSKSEENFSEQISKQVAELSYMYESDRIDQERKIMAVNLELGKVKLQKTQYIQIALFSVSFLLLSLLLISLYLIGRYKQKSKENARINADLNHVNSHLEIIVDNRTRDLLTTLKKAQESDKLKSAFLANMSHEIRTPLNGILGFTRLLSDNSLNTQTRKEYMSIIDKRGRSLLQIINDIINISLIDSGQVEIKYTSFNLNKLLFDLYTIFNSDNCDKKKESVELKLHLSLSDSRSNIVCDPVRLEQIITNLLDNAMKYTRKGIVEFGYKLDGDSKITFFVNDTGIGIAESKREIIFSRFNKQSDDLPYNPSGTGLGLPICKGLVTLLKGNIWFETEENVGSTFNFSIPYTPSNIEGQTYTSRSSVSSKSPDFSNKTILIVEDDLISYQFIEALLMDTDAKLLHAKNGEDAIEIARIADIDLVIMDMRLPFINGYEATLQIKSFKPNLTIIAQTANVMREDKDKCIKVGCDDFIPKPIDPDEFLRLVAHYINNPVLS
jgi:signal transduction histidine kinase/CheY-like chemotaxis protein/Tfp pilus assembly protein PilF